jgi:hypothetical protein
MLPSTETLSPQGIQAKKLHEMELTSHDAALLKKLIETSDSLVRKINK